MHTIAIKVACIVKGTKMSDIEKNVFYSTVRTCYTDNYSNNYSVTLPVTG